MPSGPGEGDFYVDVYAGRTSSCDINLATQLQDSITLSDNLGTGLSSTPCVEGHSTWFTYTPTRTGSIYLEVRPAVEVGLPTLQNPALTVTSDCNSLQVLCGSVGFEVSSMFIEVSAGIPLFIEVG